MTKTLQQVKDEVACEYDWVDWTCFLNDCDNYEKDVVIDEVCKRYAQEQNKELVDMLEIVYNETNHNTPLYPEILELINKHKGGQS